MNLIFDRTAEDVQAAREQRGTVTTPLKGCYNATDLNRVEAAVKALAAELNSAGYGVEITPVLKGASRLPSGFTELEYIQSSGTQYINTGVKPNGAMSVCVDFQMINQGTDQRGVFGSRPGTSGRFTMFTGKSASSLQIDYGTYASLASENASISSLNTNSRNTIEVSNSLKINGVIISSVSTVAFTSGYDMYLFANNNIGTAQLPGAMKLYSCRIYDNGTLVRNFVPAKNSFGTVGLYDIANGQFYGNSGSGAFSAGAEVGKAEDREWREGDILFRSQWETHLNNVQKLRDAYYTLEETGALPKPEDKLGYQGANTIEKVLADIDLLLEGMLTMYRRAGTFTSGGNYLRQMIRSI